MTTVNEHRGDAPSEGVERRRAALAPFEVRSRWWLLALVALVALGLAAGYAWLAHDRDDVVLYAPAGVLVLVALYFLRSLRGARAPLLVADTHGIRLRSRKGWVGYLWSEISDISIRPRGVLRSPMVRVVSRDDTAVHTVRLGLSTNRRPARTEVELARRREAAPY